MLGRNIVDLGAIGLAPETVALIQAEEDRVAKLAQSMPGLALNAAVDANGQAPATRASPVFCMPSSPPGRLVARQNQVHYYIRAIQMEQLQEQDLDADTKHMSEELDRTIVEAKGGQSFAAAQGAKVPNNMCITYLPREYLSTSHAPARLCGKIQ